MKDLRETLFNWKHSPRPLVEDHYHIIDLITKQEKRSQERDYLRQKEKDKQERNDVIKDSEPIKFMMFWCNTCNIDFKSLTFKQIEEDWSNTTQNIAFYKTKCECGKWCMRLITDRFKDAYWFKSKLVARDRGLHALDMIQPYQTNYNLLYGKK